MSREPHLHTALDLAKTLDRDPDHWLNRQAIAGVIWIAAVIILAVFGTHVWVGLPAIVVYAAAWLKWIGYRERYTFGVGFRYGSALGRDEEARDV